MIFAIKQYIPNRVKRAAKRMLRNISDSIQYFAISGHGLGRLQPPGGRRLSSIIFVCKGNVCRSAFAELRLRYLLDCNAVEVDSCGMDVDQGEYAPADSVSVTAEFSCSLDGRRSKGLSACDFQAADLICPMEYRQYKRLLQLYPEKKENIILLRNLAPFPWRLFCNIDDPYGLGKNEFRRVYRLIDRSLLQIRQWC
jgi:protein-tyrosine phosphatase